MNEKIDTNAPVVKQGYSPEFYRKAGEFIVEATTLTTFAKRMTYFENKLENNPDFEKGSNLLMDTLFGVVENKDKNYTREQQAYALNAANKFFPKLSETDEGEGNQSIIEDKKAAQQSFIKESLKFVDDSDALGSIARKVSGVNGMKLGK